MKSVVRVSMLAVAAAIVLSSASQAEAGLFGCFKKNRCCKPAHSCCAPEPTCCEPEPTCCAPEPSCGCDAPVADCGCAPEPTCCEPEPCCKRKRCGLFARLKARRCCRKSCCEPEPCCAAEPSCGCEAPVSDCGCGEAAPVEYHEVEEHHDGGEQEPAPTA